MWPTLSICIPTYQRREALKNTLEHLVKVVRQEPNNMEICVSDNGSTDGTWKILQRYGKLPFVKIRRNKKNIGYDRNLIETLKMAKGKYCWTMGDDDPIVPSRVRSLLDPLDGNIIAAITFPKRIGWEDQDTFKSELYEKQEFQKECLRNIRKFGTRANLAGFMGCFIIKRKLLEYLFGTIRFQKTNGEFYGWAHFAFFLYVISNYNGKIAIIHENVVDETAQDRINSNLRNDKIFTPGEMIETFLDGRQKAIRRLSEDKFVNELHAIFESERSIMLIKAWMKMIALKGEISTELYERFRNELNSHPLELLVGNNMIKRLLMLIPSMKLVVQSMKEYAAGMVKTNREREMLSSKPSGQSGRV